MDILVEASYAAVFDHHPAIHKVLVLDKCHRSFVSGWPRLRAAFAIRKKNYAAVWNLHGGTTSLFFTAIAGAPTRIGQQKHRGSWLYTVRIPPSDQIWHRSALHTVEHQLTLLRWLGLAVPSEPRGRLYIHPMAKKIIRERLASIAVSDYIVVQPTATLKTKQWSPIKFAELGDRLKAKYGVPVIYTAGPHEIADLKKIQAAAAETHTYWADLKLQELFALIDGSLIFVGNDSGPTHAAAALGKPLVVIWGSSDFHAWHPWGCEYQVVSSQLPCMPCPGYKCKVFHLPKCILDISVSQVFEACERLLTRTGKFPR